MRTETGSGIWLQRKHEDTCSDPETHVKQQALCWTLLVHPLLQRSSAMNFSILGHSIREPCGYRVQKGRLGEN